MILGIDFNIDRVPLPRPWTDEHDDGTKTYTRAEVLNLIANTAAAQRPFGDPCKWALVMLDTYDGAK